MYLSFVVFHTPFFIFFLILLKGLENFLSLFFILIVALAFPMPSLSIFLNILIRFVPVEDSMFWFFIWITIISVDYLIWNLLFLVLECFLFWKPNFNHILIEIFYFKYCLQLFYWQYRTMYNHFNQWTQTGNMKWYC